MCSEIWRWSYSTLLVRPDRKQEETRTLMISHFHTPPHKYLSCSVSSESAVSSLICFSPLFSSDPHPYFLPTSSDWPELGCEPHRIEPLQDTPSNGHNMDRTNRMPLSLRSRADGFLHVTCTCTCSSSSVCCHLEYEHIGRRAHDTCDSFLSSCVRNFPLEMSNLMCVEWS